jgi:hypothetical protein
MTECMRRSFIGPLAQEVLRRLPLAHRRKEVMPKLRIEKSE